jgi:hypothetical protein
LTYLLQASSLIKDDDNILSYKQHALQEDISYSGSLYLIKDIICDQEKFLKDKLVLKFPNSVMQYRNNSETTFYSRIAYEDYSLIKCQGMFQNKNSYLYILEYIESCRSLDLRGHLTAPFVYVALKELV